jgi:hypothetical protein
MVLLANQSFSDPQQKNQSNVRIKRKCANIDFMIAVGGVGG